MRLAGDIYPHLFEIISVDSVQWFKYLDIGSNKVSFLDRKRVRHHLIDDIFPDAHVDVAFFVTKTEQICDDIFRKGHIPFFVGGSGLYLDAFFKGLSKIPDIASHYRDQLLEEKQKKGLYKLYQELCAHDPEAAAKIHEHDAQRIIRALEVFRSTGKPITYYQGKRQGYESEDTLYLGLKVETNSLYATINQRVECMIENGLIEEVQQLQKMGYTADLQSMQAIGYAEIWAYLKGRLPLQDAIAKIKRESRRYAKRQLTWFKKNKKICWFYHNEIDEICKVIDAWLKTFSIKTKRI